MSTLAIRPLHFEASKTVLEMSNSSCGTSYNSHDHHFRLFFKLFMEPRFEFENKFRSSLYSIVAQQIGIPHWFRRNHSFKTLSMTWLRTMEHSVACLSQLDCDLRWYICGPKKKERPWVVITALHIVKVDSWRTRFNVSLILSQYETSKFLNVWQEECPFV